MLWEPRYYDNYKNYSPLHLPHSSSSFLLPLHKFLKRLAVNSKSWSLRRLITMMAVNSTDSRYQFTFLNWNSRSTVITIYIIYLKICTTIQAFSDQMMLVAIRFKWWVIDCLSRNLLFWPLLVVKQILFSLITFLRPPEMKRKILLCLPVGDKSIKTSSGSQSKHMRVTLTIWQHCNKSKILTEHSRSSRSAII